MYKLFHIDEKISQLIPLITDDFIYNRQLISLYYSSISYDHRIFNHKFNIKLLTQLFDKNPECMIVIFNLIKKETWKYDYRIPFKPKTSDKPIIMFYDKITYTKQSQMLYTPSNYYSIEYFIFA